MTRKPGKLRPESNLAKVKHMSLAEKVEFYRKLDAERAAKRQAEITEIIEAFKRGE